MLAVHNKLMMVVEGELADKPAGTVGGVLSTTEVVNKVLSVEVAKFPNTSLDLTLK